MGDAQAVTFSEINYVFGVRFLLLSLNTWHKLLIKEGGSLWLMVLEICGPRLDGYVSLSAEREGNDGIGAEKGTGGEQRKWLGLTQDFAAKSLGSTC